MLQLKEKEGVLWMVGTVAGQRVRRSTKLPKRHRKEADRIRIKTEDEIILGKTKGPTGFDAVKDYLTNEKVGATSTAHCLQFQEKFGKVHLGDLDLAKVRDAFWTKGAANETIRRRLGAVQAMLNWNVEYHSMVGVSFKFKKPRPGDPRLRFLEDNEVQALIEASPDWFKPTLLGLLYTGMRRGELAKLTWNNVRNDHFHVSTRKGRSGKKRWRAIAINNELKPLIGHGSGNEPVFKNSEGGSWAKYPMGINRHFSLVAEKAGVDDVTPHDARRTFASKLLEKGIDLRTIADLLGHTSLDLLMTYVQARADGKQNAVGSVSY